MIPRKNFVRVMNKKARPLIDRCKPDETSLSSDIHRKIYTTPALVRVLPANASYALDYKKLETNESQFYDIVAELDKDFSIVSRNGEIPNLQTIAMWPEDIESRLKSAARRKSAIEDLMLLDEFLCAFCHTNNLAMLLAGKDGVSPNNSAALLSSLCIKKIDEAIKRLEAR